MVRERGNAFHVQVYAGRDPLTSKKRYKSKIIRGTGRASWKEARKAEGDLLREVEGRKHKAPKSFTITQLLDQWLEWRETNGKEISPSTLYNYRLQLPPDHRDQDQAGSRSPGGLRRRRAHPGPLSASRVRDVHAILSGALVWPPAGATSRSTQPSSRALPRTAARRELPRPRRRPRPFLKAAAEESTEFEIYVRIGATIGLRRGEICALHLHPAWPARHFVATELGAVAEAGTVKSRLGHGSLAVSSISTHRVSKADRDAAKHMGKVLDGRPARSRQRPKTG